MSAGLDEAVYARLLGEYQPRPIHDDHENERAIAMLERLAAVQDPTPEQLAVGELLVTLIERYEQRYGIAKAAPLDILRELMDANDMKQKDIAEVIGSSGVTSQILSGQRAISKGVAHKLGARFGLPHTLFL